MFKSGISANHQKFVFLGDKWSKIVHCIPKNAYFDGFFGICRYPAFKGIVRLVLHPRKLYLNGSIIVSFGDMDMKKKLWTLGDCMFQHTKFGNTSELSTAYFCKYA